MDRQALPGIPDQRSAAQEGCKRAGIGSAVLRRRLPHFADLE